MREVILSSDGEAMLCRVPDAVAENLEDYCRAFAENWLWQSPTPENTAGCWAGWRAWRTQRRTSSTI